jgi:hypothetical protein
MKKKKFDCVEMKRAAALQIYEETKDLTFEKKVAYWQAKNKEALRRHEQHQARPSRGRRVAG